MNKLHKIIVLASISVVPILIPEIKTPTAHMEYTPPDARTDSSPDWRIAGRINVEEGKISVVEVDLNSSLKPPTS